jgi:hypothetical protein
MDLRTFRTFAGHSRVLDCALLIAGFNTGGGETFAGAHYAREFRTIHKGNEIKDSVTLRLVRRSSD